MWIFILRSEWIFLVQIPTSAETQANGRVSPQIRRRAPYNSGVVAFAYFSPIALGAGILTT